MINMLNRVQYSKIVYILSTIVFVLTLAYSLTHNGDGMYNTIIYTTAITVSGSAYILTVGWYMKKSGAENAYKLLCMLAEKIHELEMDGITKKAEIKNKYKLTDIDLSEMENQSSLDEMKTKVLNDTSQYLDNAMSEAIVPTEIPNVQ